MTRRRRAATHGMSTTSTTRCSSRRARSFSRRPRMPQSARRATARSPSKQPIRGRDGSALVSGGSGKVRAQASNALKLWFRSSSERPAPLGCRVLGQPAGWANVTEADTLLPADLGRGFPVTGSLGYLSTGAQQFGVLHVAIAQSVGHSQAFQSRNRLGIMAVGFVAPALPFAQLSQQLVRIGHHDRLADAPPTLQGAS